jgi:hypothetical protein
MDAAGSVGERVGGLASNEHAVTATQAMAQKTRRVIRLPRLFACSAQRVPPPQTGKAGEPAIRCDPLAAGFYGEGSVIGVRDEVAMGACLSAQLREQIPVARPRRLDHAVWLGPDGFGKRQRILERCRPNEYLPVRDHTKEAAQRELRDAEGQWRRQLFRQETVVSLVVGSVLAVGINEDVDGEQDHASMTSRRWAESSSVTPARRPLPRKVGSSTGGLASRARFRPSTSRNPLSMRDVSVTPASAA